MPEEYGLFQLSLSVLYIFSTISLFSYDRVIILYNKKLERDEIISLNVVILFFTSFLIFILLMYFGNSVLNLLNAQSLLEYKYTLIFLLFGSGVFLISRNIYLTNKNYKGIANNNIAYQVIYSTSQIGFGLISPKFYSLLVGQLLAFFISSAIALKQNIVKFSFKISVLRSHFIKNIKFLYFETPAAFLYTSLLQLPIFFITKYHGVEYTGYYSMALIIVNAPLSLLTGSIAQVYFKSASDLYNTNRKEMIVLYRNTFKKLTMLIIIPSVLIILTSGYIVEIFLGKNWTEVAWILQIYVISKIFEFLHTPLNTTLLILNKQEISFLLVGIGFIIQFSSLFLFRFDFHTMIIALTISSSIYNLLHNYTIYKILKSV